MFAIIVNQLFKKNGSFFGILLFLLFFSSPLKANDFVANNEIELQTALNIAAGNGQDDTVTLGSTTFSIANNFNDAFRYDTLEGNSLTILGAGAGQTILDGAGLGAILVLRDNSANNFVIEVRDLTITNGNDDGSEAGNFSISTLDGNILVENCSILNNQSTDSNGGVNATSETGNLDFINNTVQNNQAAINTGGARLASLGGNVNVIGNTFDNNKTSPMGGGQVGGADVASALGEIVFSDNLVTNNTTPGNMGGAFVRSGPSQLTVSNNTFVGNQSGNLAGGALLSTITGDLLVNANRFSQNQSLQGGGVYLDSASNTIFTNNILDQNNSGTGDGGGAYIDVMGPGLQIINNTAWDNFGDSGGGVFIQPDPVATITNVYNNIVINNNANAPSQGADIWFNGDGGLNALLFNNDFSETCFSVAACDPVATLGGNQGDNLSVDPLFVNAASGDFRLQASSPVIDQGSGSAPALPSEDFAGDPRVLGPQPDMGALETLVRLILDPLSHDYGEVTLSNQSSLILTLSNTGNTPININSMTLSDLVNYNLNVNGGTTPCGSETLLLEAGASCTVEVIFGPTVLGVLSTTFTVDSEDPNNPQLVANLTGTGVQTTAGDISGGGGCHLWKSGRSVELLSLLALGLGLLVLSRKLKFN